MKKIINIITAAAISASIGTASAANFFIVAPIKPAQSNSAIQVALNAAPVFQARVNKPFSYDLKALLEVTGDTSLDKAMATWSAAALPNGLSLTDGVVSGTPSAKTAVEGQSVNVSATYKTKTGQQVYTFVVDNAVLEATKVVSKASTSCALTVGGDLKCWGYHGAGLYHAQATTPQLVVGLASGVTDFDIGANSICAVVNGGLKCWGDNGSGQLGIGSTETSETPVSVQTLDSGVVQVSLGSGHACALLSTGSVKCWGFNQYGIGDGSTAMRTIPVTVTGFAQGGDRATKITSGSHHACALLTTGAVKCWGAGVDGALGNGQFTSSAVPQTVSGLNAVSLSSGGFSNCAITTAGEAKCWGFNFSGQLGDGTTVKKGVPTPVMGLGGTVATIATGGNHSCAKLSSGAVQCWGYNSAGQVGDGTKTNRVSPTTFQGLTSPVSDVILAGDSTFFLMASREVQAVGGNSFGQLGNGTKLSTTTPTVVLE